MFCLIIMNNFSLPVSGQESLFTIMFYLPCWGLANRECIGLLRLPHQNIIDCIAEISEIYFLTVLKDRSPRSRSKIKVQGFWWNLFLVCRYPASHHVLTWSFLFGVYSYENTNPIGSGPHLSWYRTDPSVGVYDTLLLKGPPFFSLGSPQLGSICPPPEERHLPMPEIGEK